MEGITYYLYSKDKEYYKIIKIFAKNFMKDNRNNVFVKDFQKFVNDNNIEELRNEEEYYIEYLLIGILFVEYLENANYFKNRIKFHYQILNNIRNKLENKEQIDKIRGKINYKLVNQKKVISNKYTFENCKNLLKWLKATGDFKEELFRLNNWIAFLKVKGNEYNNKLLKSTVNNAKEFYKEADFRLNYFVKNVDNYLINVIHEHKNKEDIIYCSKGKIQYYFNMFSAEVLNNLYKDKFTNSKKKIVFLPSCMGTVENKCASIISEMGSKCIGCSKNCNINKLNVMGSENNFSVRIISHESSLLIKHSKDNSNIGIVGIACMLNLLSGGWKALRLGFTPQCVILNCSGCKKHWCKIPIMTEINIYEFKKVMEI